MGSDTRWYVVNQERKVLARFHKCLIAEARRCAKRMFPGEKRIVIGRSLLSKGQRDEATKIPVWTIEEWCEFTGTPLEEIQKPGERERRRQRIAAWVASGAAQ